VLDGINDALAAGVNLPNLLGDSSRESTRRLFYLDADVKTLGEIKASPLPSRREPSE
jgi:hypothetical protein